MCDGHCFQKVNASVAIYLGDIKLSTFSDIWTIDKIDNKSPPPHELRMRFKLLNFARKLF